MPGRCPGSTHFALPRRSPAPAAASPPRQPLPSPQVSAPLPDRPPPAPPQPVVLPPPAPHKHPAGWPRSYSPSARRPHSDKPDTERNSRHSSRTTEPLPNPNHRPPEPPMDCKPSRNRPDQSSISAHIHPETRRDSHTADSRRRGNAHDPSKSDVRIPARGTYTDAARTLAHRARRKPSSDRRAPPVPLVRRADRDERSCRARNHGTRPVARRHASSSPSREVLPRCDYPPVIARPSSSSAKRSCCWCGRRAPSRSWSATWWLSFGLPQSSSYVPQWSLSSGPPWLSSCARQSLSLYDRQSRLRPVSLNSKAPSPER